MALPSYIHFSDDPAETLQQLLGQFRPDQMAILVDENTEHHCLPKLPLLESSPVIRIRSGEANKNLNTCEAIWSEMTRRALGRKSLLVNLGGGVIGDMGGFAAATYKRGIRFVNLPTTLLAAVDANIGGKLGIDFQGFKNHLGLFRDPDAVIICPDFLQTLPIRELRSGFAESLKHGLIRDQQYWKLLIKTPWDQQDWPQVIRRSVEIKKEVVAADPYEQGLRKILNYGHTLGHAVETCYLNQGDDLLHGEAIAVGMILEAHLAWQKGLLSPDELKEISNVLTGIYGKVSLPSLGDLLPIMQQDKKNLGSEISFSLLNGIGNCLYDEKIEVESIEAAMDYYEKIK